MGVRLDSILTHQATKPPSPPREGFFIAMTQTRFANRKNPWTGEKMTKTNKPMRLIDPSELEICNDPLPATRSAPEGKYTPIFSKLKYGQSLKCPQGAAPKIATALKKWLEVNKKPGTVRSALRYAEDGTGRVWLLEPEKQLKVA